MTTTVLNIKICEAVKKNSDNSRYFTTQEFNKLTAENLAGRLKQADLISKTFLIIN